MPSSRGKHGRAGSGSDEERGRLLHSRGGSQDDDLPPIVSHDNRGPAAAPTPTCAPEPHNHCAEDDDDEEEEEEQGENAAEDEAVCSSSSIPMSLSQQSQQQHHHHHHPHHQRQNDQRNARNTAAVALRTSTSSRGLTKTAAGTPTSAPLSKSTSHINSGKLSERKIHSIGSLESKTSTTTRDTNKTNSSRRTAAPLHPKVIYYNNRFITITSAVDNNNKPTLQGGNLEATTASSSASNERRNDAGSSGTAHAREDGESLIAGDSATNPRVRGGSSDAHTLGGSRNHPTERDMEVGQTSTSATHHDPQQADIEVDVRHADKKKSPSSREIFANSFLAKLSKIIQDNRMRDGDKDTAKKLKEMNKNQEQRHQILKRVLNIIFVTTGIVLFLAVVVVIIYTSVGK